MDPAARMLHQPYQVKTFIDTPVEFLAPQTKQGAEIVEIFIHTQTRIKSNLLGDHSYARSNLPGMDPQVNPTYLDLSGIGTT
jgi:hypothetical protein